MPIDAIGILCFLIVVYIDNKLQIRYRFAVLLAGLLPVFIKFFIKVSPNLFFSKPVNALAVFQTSELMVFVAQFVVVALTFVYLKRNSDAVANYIATAVVGSLVGYMFVPYAVSVLAR